MLSGWDTSFTLRDLDNWLGLAPVLTFNDTSEVTDTPDNTFWSRGDGSSDSVFSVGAWLDITHTTAYRTVLGKWDDSTAGGAGSEKREWNFGVDTSDKIILWLLDESVTSDGAPNRVTDSAVSMGE